MRKVSFLPSGWFQSVLWLFISHTARAAHVYQLTIPTKTASSMYVYFMVRCPYLAWNVYMLWPSFSYMCLYSDFIYVNVGHEYIYIGYIVFT